MILATGFVGFNVGSVLHISHPGDDKKIGLAAANTMLAGAGGMITVVIATYIRHRKFPLMSLHCGLLAGNVAVCAGCEVYDGWSATAVGFLAGGGYLLVAYFVQLFQIDDPVEAIAGTFHSILHIS